MQDKAFSFSRRSWRISHNDSFLYFILMVNIYFNSSIADFFLLKCHSLSSTHLLSCTLPSSAHLPHPTSSLGGWGVGVSPPPYTYTHTFFTRPIFCPTPTFVILPSSSPSHFLHPPVFCPPPPLFSSARLLSSIFLFAHLAVL